VWITKKMFRICQLIAFWISFGVSVAVLFQSDLEGSSHKWGMLCVLVTFAIGFSSKDLWSTFKNTRRFNDWVIMISVVTVLFEAFLVQLLATLKLFGVIQWRWTFIFIPIFVACLENHAFWLYYGKVDKEYLYVTAATVGSLAIDAQIVLWCLKLEGRYITFFTVIFIPMILAPVFIVGLLIWKHKSAFKSPDLTFTYPTKPRSWNCDPILAYQLVPE